jgi:hypothetical protein
MAGTFFSPPPGRRPGFISAVPPGRNPANRGLADIGRAVSGEGNGLGGGIVNIGASPYLDEAWEILARSGKPMEIHPFFFIDKLAAK